jgi:hypothetical protein
MKSIDVRISLDMCECLKDLAEYSQIVKFKYSLGN